jgi:hypothetical protein
MALPSNQGKPESEAPTNPTAGEPAAPQAPITPESAPTAPAATEQPTTHSPKVADVDGYKAKREAALKPLEPKQEQPGEPAAPVEPPAEPADPQSPEPPADPTLDPAPDADATPKEFRPRLGSLPEDEKEAIALRKTLKDQGKDVPLDECLKRVRAKYEVPTDGQQIPGEPAAPVRTAEDVVADITAKEAEADQAAADLDLATVNRINREIRALEREQQQIERQQAEAAQRQQQTQLSAFEQEVQAAEAAVVQQYPAAADPNHAIHAEAERIFALLEKTGNPKAKEADSSLWVYQQAANKLGMLPVDPDSQPTPARAAGTKPSTSATPKPQPVIQTAVSGRPAQPSLAPGSARTSTPGQPDPILVKPSTRHEYEQKLAKLGIRQAA